MGHTLSEIAQLLSSPKVFIKTINTQTTDIPPREIQETKPVPKVQLIYAFNGTGKTRLSREFKQLIAPKSETEDEETGPWLAREKILYYNAFTEDLFYWDNDLENDSEPKLKIQPNKFTDWLLKDQGQDQNIITIFQRYTNDKLTPKFNPEYTTTDKDGREVTVKANSEVTFSMQRGNDRDNDKLKISKGEESNFIWSVFYATLEQIIRTLNGNETSEIEENGYDKLKYVFIDDPVSSLDENHLIQLALDLVELIKSCKASIKFIITTHNPLFYNVLFNSFQKEKYKKYLLERSEDGNYNLIEKDTDSPFSYHLYLMSELEKNIATGEIKKYHFNFLRNILEKTSTYLGYKDWKDLLPSTPDGMKEPYKKRLDLYSHSKHSGDEIDNIPEDDKRVLGFIYKYFKENYKFKSATNT
ncbi:anticodon nuclease [Leptospira meyeri]|uniref:AAA family ATPase n=1 Tax=Leptospira meyeri TaxID=29508 RepID=UPI000C299887|nr:AAA family ATPase [Leptospira meyeri]PKA10634.1 anticodon nuclease [Leptospira meyeri]PKA23007.1 anticodon nuclease [Leptospira sp. mixed culture ATI2-C-A1]TGM64176.1 anticodon nuclease [Leptospira meyeri]TGM67357.1 anticodon nuclease [Leptospira meyeri]